MRFLIMSVFAVIILVGCKSETSREVSLVTTPDGHQYYFMPILEKGVTDITITAAWPSGWAYEAGKNQAVPYVAADVLVSGGTAERAPQDVMELMNDRNSYAHFYVTANHAIGEVEFPKEHRDVILPIVREMLIDPQFDPKWIERVKQGWSAKQLEQSGNIDYGLWSAARQLVLGSPYCNLPLRR